MRAGIDIGTNSVRLLVRDGDVDLERLSVITRLGAGFSWAAVNEVTAG